MKKDFEDVNEVDWAIDEYGTKVWYNKKGEIHREDGPAKEYLNGNRAWYRNGELHREDGPALEQENGKRSWWYNGLPHRKDGPAFEYPNGECKDRYYVDGYRRRDLEAAAQSNSIRSGFPNP